MRHRFTLLIPIVASLVGCTTTSASRDLVKACALYDSVLIELVVAKYPPAALVKAAIDPWIIGPNGVCTDFSKMTDPSTPAFVRQQVVTILDASVSVTP